ncbi:MAG TPA: hypothetical protein VHZ55_05950 [Bryobacteraceae bacterium]|jgi:hypothetical protein|nr:hypothetical protein [Bryobacteraceae bacterium]
MGELIVMPKRDGDAAKTVVNAVASTPECVAADAARTESASLDLSVWKRAPKERTAEYFPTYSTVSKAIQTAMRSWVRDWFHENTEILLRPHTAYPILVYQCTHPFSGRPTNMFTYDIQQTEALNRAFASAAYRLGRELKTIDTKRFGWFTREHYFAYRSKEVVKYVAKNRRALYKMLNVETVLMDSILKFAIIDIPKLGLEEASVLLRRAFNTQLRRFSDEFDFSSRTEQLLRIATEALNSKLPNGNVVTMPVRQQPVDETLPIAA